MTRLLTIVVGVIAAVYGAGFARLFATNSHIPRAYDHGSLESRVIVILGAVLASCVLMVVMEQLRRSPLLALFITLALAFIAFELYPRACQQRQGGQVSQTCICRGWEVQYYPKGVSQSADIRYCVGVEIPLD